MSAFPKFRVGDYVVVTIDLAFGSGQILDVRYDNEVNQWVYRIDFDDHVLFPESINRLLYD